MYLWRNLPQGQLGAVMTWLFTRRQPPAKPLTKSAGETPAQATGKTAGD